MVENLLADLPDARQTEQFTQLLQRPGLRIERIVSRGQCSPPDDWYDQNEHEWVLLLQGAAELMLADGSVIRLTAGDHVYLPAHEKHRVHWTDPQQDTVWLAVFHH